MRILLPAALAAALLASPLPLAAQGTGATTAMPGVSGGVMTRLQQGQIRAKDLMDRDLRSSDDVEVGEVEDLVIDPATGRILAVVVEIERALGFTEKHVAIPLERLRLGESRRATIAMTREELRAMPGFDYRD